MAKQIYNLAKEEVFAQLDSDEKGLAELEAQLRLKKYGKNTVARKQNWNWLTILGHQFNDALVWILLVACALSLVFGEMRDAVIIALIVAINALIGFLQEYKAEKTIENIRQLASDQAIALRDGQRKQIDASLLVPGDIIYLTSGDTVPADAYLLETFGVYANEFIFTGESKPSKKFAGVISGENLNLSEMDNLVFMGTSLTRGSATAIIVGTGMNTELGHIANLVSEVEDGETPLQKQMRVLGRDVTVLAICIATLVLIAGQYYHISLYENFLFALALAVSVVPEGLPAAISVALSLGMKKLLKGNVLAKKLNAVETLASVNAICTDKTGTITRNELMVTDIVMGADEFKISGQGYALEGEFSLYGRRIELEKYPQLEQILRIGAICNESSINLNNGKTEITGDPTEAALLVAARKVHADTEYYSNNLIKINENPFSSERMRMSVICQNKSEKTTTAFVKGSPDVILNLCSHMQSGNEVIELTQEAKQKIINAYNSMSARALRVLAFAQKNISVEGLGNEQLLAEAEKGLVWVGLMGMIDPPRLDVSKAIEQCLQSGIKVIMITGDYELTAEAIAKEVGLIKTGNSEVINGKMLHSLTDEQLMEKIFHKEIVFARITPEQKLRIAKVLKAKEMVIAMTGDGVNDAPALKSADIGVAMGIIGTDVAKEAADMILLDDNFASIVKVIKEARTVYQNLKKFVYYVFTSNVSEFFTVVIGLLLQIPAPISAVQILAIDLGTDIFPSFSLGLEPAEPNIMTKKPFSSKEKVINAQGVRRLIRVGLIMATGAVTAFILSMKRGGWDFGNKIDTNSVLYLKSTSATYAVLSMSQMANLLAARSESLSVFKLGFFKNKFVFGAIAISIGILLSFMYVPILQKYLHMLPITWQDWSAVVITTLAVFIFEEGRKAEILSRNIK